MALPGAQTERRGGAGPVKGLLGRKDLTGRFIFEFRNQASGLLHPSFLLPILCRWSQFHNGFATSRPRRALA
jgi:hypothetical protein